MATENYLLDMRSMSSSCRKTSKTYNISRCSLPCVTRAYAQDTTKRTHSAGRFTALHTSQGPTRLAAHFTSCSSVPAAATERDTLTLTPPPGLGWALHC